MCASISGTVSPRQSLVSALQEASWRPSSSATSCVQGARIPHGGRQSHGSMPRFRKAWSPSRVSASTSWRERCVWRTCFVQ